MIRWLVMIGMLFLLIVSVVEDWKRRQVNGYHLLLHACVALGIRFFDGSVWEACFGIFPGAFLLLMAFLSHQKIGYGDGALFLVSGLYMGIADNLLLLMLSLVFCSLAGGLSIVLRKKNAQSELPFLPFVLLGYLVMAAGEL